ncbi:MAG: POTRA domain-containing protein, partial [Terriglobales bacterium]
WLPLPELITELDKRVPLFHGELPMQAGGRVHGDVAAALQGLLNERGVKTTVSFAPAGPREGITEAYVYTADEVEVKIGQLNLAGNSPAFSPLLEAATRPLLGTHFQRSTIAKFVAKNLLDVYRSKGYLKAEFGAPQVTVANHKDAETTVAITLPVVEGRVYTFGGAQWSGNSVRPSPWLDERIRLRAGQAADGVQLDADLTKIRAEYAQLGYMHMHLDVQPAYDAAAGKVRYEIAVKEGGLFSMGKLDIAGLQPSSAERVRQAWRMREGDPYDAGYVSSFFEKNFRLPPGVAYVVEQSEGEATNSVDLTLIFCKEDQKCLASAPNQLYIPDPEPRRKR